MYITNTAQKTRTPTLLVGLETQKEGNTGATYCARGILRAITVPMLARGALANDRTARVRQDKSKYRQCTVMFNHIIEQRRCALLPNTFQYSGIPRHISNPPPPPLAGGLFTTELALGQSPAHTTHTQHIQHTHTHTHTHPRARDAHNTHKTRIDI